jgi:hypothetical protein
MRAVRRGGSHKLNESLAAIRLRRSFKFKLLLFSLTISAILIFMRSVYRVIELSEGWKGELMSNERFVIWLEAIPVAISGFFLAIIHPANCFKDDTVPVEHLEMPETPPSVSSGRAAELEKRNSRETSRYGNMTVTLDPTFDRTKWR